MSSYKTFADALSAPPEDPSIKRRPKAVNDNKPKRIRNNTTLPALRWLYDNHPELAPAMAEAVQSLSMSNWDAEAVDSEHAFSPTVGEIVNAASDGVDAAGLPIWKTPTVEKYKDGSPYVSLGALVFKGGELVEFGRTKKGRKLQPRERIVARAEESTAPRNPRGYISLSGAVLSPMHAETHQRPISTEPALQPMYDPQKGVELNRALLVALGADGGVPFDRLPVLATKCPAAIAKGAEFLGGVVQSSGTSSSGAIMWEAPTRPKGEARRVVEEVAAGATLKAIGEEIGYKGGYAIRTAGEILVDAAMALIAANDNKRKKIASLG